MNDAEIVQRIDKLVDQEHAMERQHAEGGLSDTERVQLEQLEVQLDQCWDLLRQRRARRDAGQNPDEAQARGPEVVERYQQ